VLGQPGRAARVLPEMLCDSHGDYVGS
jgi:hypothetical protein